MHSDKFCRKSSGDASFKEMTNVNANMRMKPSILSREPSVSCHRDASSIVVQELGIGSCVRARSKSL